MDYDDLIGELPKPKKLRPLTPKQARFVAEYLIDPNKKTATLRAGYGTAEHNARVHGQLIADSPAVAAAIKEGQAQLAARLNITAERVLREYAKIAFFDIRKLLDDTGGPLPLTSLDDDTAGALTALDVNVSHDNEGRKIGEVMKYKMADKKAALDSLAKHLNLTPDKVDMNVDMTVNKSPNDVARRVAFLLSQAARNLKEKQHDD